MNEDLWAYVPWHKGCDQESCLAYARKMAKYPRRPGAFVPVTATDRDRAHAGAHIDASLRAGELRFERVGSELRAVDARHTQTRVTSAADRQAKVRKIMAERSTWRAKDMTQIIRARRNSRSETADVRELTVGEARDLALRLLDDPRAIEPLGGSTRALDDLERAIRTNTDVARRAIVTETDDYRGAFTRYVREAATGNFTTDERRALQRFANTYERAQSETNGSGGFAVPVFIDPTVIVTDAPGGLNPPFFDLCTVVDITTSTWKGVASAAAVWSVDGEAVQVSDDSMTSMTQPSIPTYNVRAFLPYSIELGEDYPDFANQMAAALAPGYLDLCNSKFSTGTGTNEPTGIITALAAASPTVLITSATDGAFTDTDLQATWNGVPARFRANATWMASTTVASQIRLNSGLYHASTVTLSGQATEIVNGRQLVEMPYFPAWSSTTGADTRIVCGDFSQMTIARRRGMTVEVVPQLFGSSQRPTGQRGLFASARIGSDVPNPQAFRMQVNV